MSDQHPPASKPASTKLALAVVLIGVLPIGVAIGRLAFLSAQQGFAPVVLFSMVVGAVCGSISTLLARTLGILRIRAILAAAACCAMMATLAQHHYFYQATVERWEAGVQDFQPKNELQMQAQQQLMHPPTRRQLLAESSWTDRLRWLADALLTLASAMFAGCYVRGYKGKLRKASP